MDIEIKQLTETTVRITTTDVFTAEGIQHYADKLEFREPLYRERVLRIMEQELDLPNTVAAVRAELAKRAKYPNRRILWQRLRGGVYEE